MSANNREKMVLVPVEPTEEMMRAGADAPGLGHTTAHAHNVYRAMLAASPASETAPEPVAWGLFVEGKLFIRVVLGHKPNMAGDWRPLYAAPPPPAGEVTVTTNERGECVAVTRTDEDGQILSVIWQATPAGSREAAQGDAEYLNNRIAHAESVCLGFDAVPADEAKRVIKNVFAELREAASRLAALTGGDVSRG